MRALQAKFVKLHYLYIIFKKTEIHDRCSRQFSFELLHTFAAVEEYVYRYTHLITGKKYSLKQFWHVKSRLLTNL